MPMSSAKSKAGKKKKSKAAKAPKVPKDPCALAVTIGENVARIRTKQGKGQAEVGLALIDEATGKKAVKPENVGSTMSAVEKGVGTTRRLGQLSVALNVSVAELVTAI